jgi:UDP-GlcNAc:undecaprenyl-phosphate GlcNAc-1-phosphate transferase
VTLFVPSAVFSYLTTVLWILTVINAFNFMDNMNGLCTGLGAIAAWYFALTSAIGGQYLVALIAFLGFGSLLGFLPYNFPKARGFRRWQSPAGYLLAILAILLHFTLRTLRDAGGVILLLVLALPLFDMAWVVTRGGIGQPLPGGHQPSFPWLSAVAVMNDGGSLTRLAAATGALATAIYRG